MDEKEKQERETPIQDGDARPDMPVHVDEKKARKEPDQEKKFEKERMSDVNSLEDYKDAELKNDNDKEAG